MSKSDLYPIVADLRAMGYNPSDIARAVGRTPARICQILRALGMQPKRLRSVDDLPPDIRDRIEGLKN